MKLDAFTLLCIGTVLIGISSMIAAHQAHDRIEKLERAVMILERELDE